MANPSPGYALTLRVETPSSSNADGRLVAAVTAAGGAVTALDVVGSRADQLVVDVTYGAIDAAHGAAITETLDAIPHVDVRKVSDRTFLLHFGGKLEVVPKRTTQAS